MKNLIMSVAIGICLVLAGCAAPGSGRTFDLKKIGKAVGSAYDSVRSYTPEEEEAIGARVMAGLLGAAPLVKDQALQHYVNQVGEWVALQSDKPELKWRFGVTNDPHINSFAAPGGYILITKGLFDRLNSEAELAAVLGHEVIHVTRGHLIRAIKANAKGDFFGGMVKVGADAQGGDEAKYAANAGSGLMEVAIRKFDKDDEFDADVNGMVLAARAGYNPYALPGVLTSLGNINPKDDAVAKLFSTHPSPRERLDKIDALVGDKLERYAGGVESTPTFARFHK